MEENKSLSETTEIVDIQTYKTANRRANFKKHAALYALVLIVVWLLYIFIFKNNSTNEMSIFLKGTLFVTLIWSVIIFFHYLFVYRLNNSLIDREIKKLQEEIREKEAQLQTLKEQKATIIDATEEDH